MIYDSHTRVSFGGNWWWYITLRRWKLLNYDFLSLRTTFCGIICECIFIHSCMFSALISKWEVNVYLHLYMVSRKYLQNLNIVSVKMGKHLCNVANKDTFCERKWTQYKSRRICTIGSEKSMLMAQKIVIIRDKIIPHESVTGYISSYSQIR